MINNTFQMHVNAVFGNDKNARTQAYYALMEATERPVDWAYIVWDQLVAGLTHKDHHVRAITTQLLCNLAISDPENRMQQIFPKVLHVTCDEKFVTARHCLQALWKIGLAGPRQQAFVVDGLTLRFEECRIEKNWSLIRYDIIQALKNLYDAVHDEAIRRHAFALIEQETNKKYHKKYARIWR